MKKTLLFAILLSGVLASCSSSSDKMRAMTNLNDPLAGVKEDTQAHEEIFGQPSIASPKRTNSGTSEIVANETIKLGIQFFSDGSTMAIRFVAALAAESLRDATAVWHRHIYTDAGAETKTTNTDHNVTAAYSVLNGGNGDSLNIANFDGYHHFVVYTIYNIPLATAGSYYITAHLEFDDDDTDGTEAVLSKVLATSINQNTRFVFDAAQLSSSSIFGVKKDSSSAYTTITPTETDGVSNLAKFSFLPLASGDKFLIVDRRSGFKVYGYDDMVAGDADALFAQDDSSSFGETSADTKKYYFVKLTNAATPVINAEAIDWFAVQSGYIYIDCANYLDYLDNDSHYTDVDELILEWAYIKAYFYTWEVSKDPCDELDATKVSSRFAATSKPSSVEQIQLTRTYRRRTYETHGGSYTEGTVYSTDTGRVNLPTNGDNVLVLSAGGTGIESSTYYIAPNS